MNASLLQVKMVQYSAKVGFEVKIPFIFSIKELIFNKNG